MSDHEQYFRWFKKGLWRNLIQESLQILTSQTGVNDQLNDWPDHFYGCFSSFSKLPVQLMLKWLSHQLHSPNKHAPCSWQSYRHWINSRQKSFPFTSFYSSRWSGNKWTKRTIKKKNRSCIRKENTMKSTRVRRTNRKNWQLGIGCNFQ